MAETRSRRRLALAGATAVVAVIGTVAANGAAGSAERGHGHGGRKVTVTLHDAAGDRVGRVTMRQTRGQVVVSGAARGLAPGFHGFHVHAVGLCDADAPDGPFTTAGGHYTGGLGEHGDHAGDLPPLLVTEDGRAVTSFITDRFTLDELRDVDGSAVMVHEGRDNLANIPDRYTSAGTPGPDAATLATGDAGARAACGVIR